MLFRSDWTGTAREIVDQVRGLSPHIGAYTSTGDGRRLKIWKAVEADAPAAADQQTLAESGVQMASTASGQSIFPADDPGDLAISGDRLFVRCGSGVLELIEVQLEGKRRMAATDFVRGHQKAIEDKRFRKP